MFSKKWRDRNPQRAHPSYLERHACLTLRFHSHAARYDWEFERDGLSIVKKVLGPFVFSASDFGIEAAKEGHGIAFLTEPEVMTDIEDGSLRRVLANWCPPFDGYRLCYSDRRQISSALRLLIDRLKYRD